MMLKVQGGNASQDVLDPTDTILSFSKSVQYLLPLRLARMKRREEGRSSLPAGRTF